MEPTRKSVCRYVEDNWEEIVKRSIMRSIRRWSEMTPGEVCERFMRAGKKYGEFDIRSIETSDEIEAEHLDIPGYIALEMFRAELDGQEGRR